MSVEMDKELHSEMKIKAIQKGYNSLKDLIIELCKNYLKEN